MLNLNQMELNSIRECVSSHITIASKFSSYANKVSDPEIKQMFKNSATQAEQSANKLTQML